MNTLRTLSRTLFFTILLGLLAAPGTLLAQNQTNDPLVDEQQYLFDVHRIGQAWNYTTGASNVKIGIYSHTGFIQTHEDLSSSRLASPVGSLQDPEVDIASQMAGIVGASTNNGIGMAGIDRSATLQSYSLLTEFRTCDDDSRCQENRETDEEEKVTFERSDGTQETYYLNLYRFADQISKGRSNGVDVHLVSFGLPSGDPADYPVDETKDTDLFLDLSNLEPPENPNPNPYATLAQALNKTRQRLKEANLCGEVFWIWFGDCQAPPDPATRFRDEIGFAVARDGDVVVSPAGNLNENGDLPPRHLPGMFDPYAVTVGGLQYESGVGSEPISWDRTRPASYVDVAAFAKDVVGISGTGPKQYDTNVTSTAASASIGAGVSGLLKAEMPVLTGEDIEEILKRTARDAGPPGEDDATGAGAIDAGAALGYIRNNDVQRSRQGIDYVISDKVVSTENELRGNGFWQYSSTNCKRPKGDLHEFRARISYSQTFREAPDVWTRWGESDGVLSSAGEDGAYYDPFQKGVRVVDADGRGFTVKGYYWEADFYNRIGGECQMNVLIPKSPGDFKIAYTAVGTEGPPPPSVSISGPSSRDHGEQGTWTATVNGGTGTASYDWEYRPVASASWYDTYCSGASCTHTFPNSGGMIETAGIRVSVTKGGDTDAATQLVTVLPSGDDCEDPTAPCRTPVPLSKAGPVSLFASVDAQAQSERAAQLRWATTRALGERGFVVQHRADSTAAWTEIGRVATSDSVATDTSRGATYRFQAENLSVGTHQFRLRVQTEGAKNAISSRTVSAQVRLNEAYEVTTYPNPVQSQATIELAVRERQNVTVAVYDVLGRRVTTLHDGPLPVQETRRFRLNASESGLSSGAYFVRVRGEGFAETKRLSVVR